MQQKALLNLYVTSANTNIDSETDPTQGYIGTWRTGIQPPYVIIHTVYIVLVQRCQLMIQAYVKNHPVSAMAIIDVWGKENVLLTFN